MKKIILSIVAFVAISTSAAMAQAPFIKEAIVSAVAEVAKDANYTEEQSAKITEYICQKELKISEVYKAKLPAEERGQKVKALNGECADQINALLGQKNAHKTLFTTVIKYVREAKANHKK